CAARGSREGTGPGWCAFRPGLVVASPLSASTLHLSAPSPPAAGGQGRGEGAETSSCVFTIRCSSAVPDRAQPTLKTKGSMVTASSGLLITGCRTSSCLEQEQQPRLTSKSTAVGGRLPRGGQRAAHG